MHFDEEMGFQFLGPRSTVLSPSDPRPPTVGEPTRHPCSITGMMQDNHLLQLGVTWDIYLRELRCHREEALSVMRILISESVVFHLVFWVSSFVAFVWVVFVFGVCFVSTLEDAWLFAFHLFSNNVK